ncbi:MAG: hypothetical protein RL077_2053 [Verrucomicrobiota bacterium]
MKNLVAVKAVGLRATAADFEAPAAPHAPQYHLIGDTFFDASPFDWLASPDRQPQRRRWLRSTPMNRADPSLKRARRPATLPPMPRASRGADALQGRALQPKPGSSQSPIVRTCAQWVRWGRRGRWPGPDAEQRRPTRHPERGFGRSGKQAPGIKIEGAICIRFINTLIHLLVRASSPPICAVLGQPAATHHPLAEG